MLQSEEVLYKRRNFCCSGTQKRPYAQLGSVEPSWTPAAVSVWP